jgi:hypothetical protein
MKMSEIVIIEIGKKRQQWRLTVWPQGSALTPIDDQDDNHHQAQGKRVGRIYGWDRRTEPQTPCVLARFC